MRQKESKSEEDLEKMKELRNELRKLNRLYEDCIKERRCKKREKRFRDHDLQYFDPWGSDLPLKKPRPIIVKIGDEEKYVEIDKLRDVRKTKTLGIAESEVALLRRYGDFLLGLKNLTDKLSWVVPAGGKIVKIPLQYFTYVLEYGGKASSALASILEEYIARLKLVRAVMDEEAYIVVPTTKVKIREILVCKRGRWLLEDIKVIKVTKGSSVRRRLSINHRSISRLVKDVINSTLNELQNNLEKLKMLREEAEKLK